jgi:hypothetical protein
LRLGFRGATAHLIRGTADPSGSTQTVITFRFWARVREKFSQ